MSPRPKWVGLWLLWIQPIIFNLRNGPMQVIVPNNLKCYQFEHVCTPCWIMLAGIHSLHNQVGWRMMNILLQCWYLHALRHPSFVMHTSKLSKLKLRCIQYFAWQLQAFCTPNFLKVYALKTWKVDVCPQWNSACIQLQGSSNGMSYFLWIHRVVFWMESCQCSYPSNNNFVLQL